VKIIYGDSLKSDLVEHQYENPYEKNPEYFAKLNYFYFSRDKRLVAGYWEAPEGWFDALVDGFNEINYMIEGEIKLTSKNKALLVKKGDCFLLENGDAVNFQINRFTRTIFLNYPVDERLLNEIKKIGSSASKEV